MASLQVDQSSTWLKASWYVGELSCYWHIELDWLDMFNMTSVTVQLATLFVA